ncbi:MAG TPA: hypothetical protein VKR59_05470 [Terriglobales bacterium]|nr:hypothetical protein [Terriglobales bacterium]
MQKLLVVTLSLAILCTGCSAAWVATLDSILAAAAPALINILQIVAVANGQPVNATLAAKINTDAADIKTLATDFAKLSSGSGSGVCQQLQAAVSTYQADQELVLQMAQVGDPNTQTKITLLTSLVAGTVEAITAVIPSCQTSAQAMKGTPPFNISNFAAAYNSILLAPTGNAAVDQLTPNLILHRHSKFVRLTTFGRLQ